MAEHLMLISCTKSFSFWFHKWPTQYIIMYNTTDLLVTRIHIGPGLSMVIENPKTKFNGKIKELIKSVFSFRVKQLKRLCQNTYEMLHWKINWTLCDPENTSLFFSLFSFFWIDKWGINYFSQRHPQNHFCLFQPATKKWKLDTKTFLANWNSF